MSTKNWQAAMDLRAESDQDQKQNLMRRFLEIHGELTSNNDFVGFLIAEFGLRRRGGGAGGAGTD